MPDLCHFVSKFSLGIPFFSIGRNHRNCFHLSLYHWRACSYWYLNVRGSDRWHFPLSLLCHSFVTHEIWSFYHMIEKQYKQREKKLIHVSIRHMRENGSVECDVMPVASAIMWFGTSMPTMSRLGWKWFIARQPVTMVMMRYDYRHKHHDTNKQHHILVYFLFHSHTSDTKIRSF